MPRAVPCLRLYTSVRLYRRLVIWGTNPFSTTAPIRAKLLATLKAAGVIIKSDKKCRCMLLPSEKLRTPCYIRTVPPTEKLNNGSSDALDFHSYMSPIHSLNRSTTANGVSVYGDFHARQARLEVLDRHDKQTFSHSRMTERPISATSIFPFCLYVGTASNDAKSSTTFNFVTVCPIFASSLP